MKISLVLFTLLSFRLLFGQAVHSKVTESYTYIKSNLEFLASDELEGREVTSRGEKIASLFISEELEKYGVLPFGENGTYFQEVPFIITSFSAESQIALISNQNDIKTYKNGTSIIYSSRNLPSDNYNNKKLDIVFAGHGIVSEEDNYNSYKDLDVSGKAVLLINGTPKKDGEEILGNSAVKKYSRSSSAKAELAKKMGAEALLVLADEYLLKYWHFFSSMATLKSYKLEDEVEQNINNDNIPIVILNDIAAEDLLLNENLNYNEIMESNPKSTVLKSKIILNYGVVIEESNGRNIIGLIKGKNKNYNDQYLTIGAHYDHIGISDGKINNGADDNGSGVVTVLEVARQLSMNKENERPVIIIFHTGEEKGLKGSKYLTSNASFVDSTIVHINIDMVGRKSEDSIYVIGASKISSELGELLDDVNKNSVNIILDKKFDDPNDPQRLYYRSDHIHYANKGIPIAFFYDYMKIDYHKPTDTAEKINYRKIVRISELIYELMIRISNLDHRLTKDRIDVN